MCICSGIPRRQLDSKCGVVFTDGCRSGDLNSAVSRDRQIGHNIVIPEKAPAFRRSHYKDTKLFGAAIIVWS